MITATTTPNSVLHVLHLEDSEADAELILHELKHEWPACEVFRAATRASFERALGNGPIDVILSDFALPGFDGFAALELARQARPELPFILVSGTVGEETAVAALKAGVIDYVLKDRPARLVSAIHRALRDAAEQTRARETEERFRQLAESSTDVFWFADLNPFRVRYVSPAVENVWGHKPEKFYDDPAFWLVGIHPEDRARVEQNFNAWLAGERLAFVEEYRVVRADGTVRWVHDTGAFNPDPLGRIKRVSGVARDITLTKEATEQSLRAQRLESIGLLAGGVAHDLNNALAPVLMGLDLLRPEIPPGSRSIFEQMQASTNRGAAMVRQLLGFARGAEGKRVVLDPRRALREVEQLAENTFPKNIRTELRCATGMAKVEVDPTLLHQVLLNLCVNARDAMPQGGTLTLAAENAHIDEGYAGFMPDAKPGLYALLSVTDTGIGIPADVLPKIFDPFFTTKPTDIGTGLGLTTVAGIVHNHGGFVRVESTVGRGTTFKVYLPAMMAGSRSPLVPENVTPEFHAHGELILVVDDEEPVRVLLKTLLERLGFRVLTAADGTEGLAAFVTQREGTKLVITDERMPHMDGVTLVRTLRHMRPDLGIIVMSGLNNEAKLHEFTALGVTQHLHKPFTMGQLADALRATLHPTAQPSGAP